MEHSITKSRGYVECTSDERRAPFMEPRISNLGKIRNLELVTCSLPHPPNRQKKSMYSDVDPPSPYRLFRSLRDDFSTPSPLSLMIREHMPTIAFLGPGGRRSRSDTCLDRNSPQLFGLKVRFGTLAPLHCISKCRKPEARMITMA